MRTGARTGTPLRRRTAAAQFLPMFAGIIKPMNSTPVDTPLKPEEALLAIPAGQIPAGLELVAFAGKGSFCEVWKVRDSRDGAPYALKRLRPEWRTHAAARRLLANEALIGKSVNSRHVVAAAMHQPANPEQGVVLEWLEGISLETRLREERLLPISTCIWIARQCAQGMLDLEQSGYAHGDIKPANIFLTRGGDVKLVDLGFANPTVAVASHLDTGARSANVLTGTAEYMAPESLLRQRSNPVLKDIYSLGVTLFRMLTGELPFAAETTADVLQLQRTARPPQLRRKCPAASSELSQLIQQMLAKQPIRRPSNLRGLVRTFIELELALFPQRLAGSERDGLAA
jgi:serine/threonine-protein kinase